MKTTRPQKDSPLIGQVLGGWKAYIVLLIATLVPFSPALELGWIWDDDQYVTENYALRSLQGLQEIWTTPGATPQYYPLVFSAFWGIRALFGSEPFPYHALNLGLHAVNVLLCYRIMLQLKMQYALWAALAFGLHPIQVESVAWVTELKNILSATMYGLAWLQLYPAIRRAGPTSDSPQAADSSSSRENTGENTGKNTGKNTGQASLWSTQWWFLGGTLCFAGALLSKSVTASLPAAMLVAVWMQQGRINRRQLLLAAPLLLTGAIFGWNTARLEVEFVGAQGADFQHGWLARVGIAARCVVHYGGNALAPIEQIFFYPRYDPQAWPAAIASLLVAAFALGLAIYLALRGRRGPLAGLLFFVGSAFPALGFLNVYPHRFSFVADHFAYIPIAGLVAMIATGLAALGQRLYQRFAPQASPWVGYSLITLWLVFLTLGTVRHIPSFADEITLWEVTLQKNPTSVIAMHNLAMRYHAAGRAVEALPLLENALDFQLDRFQILNTLGVVHTTLGNRDAAAQAFGQSIDAFANNPLATHNLAKVLMESDATSATPGEMDPEIRDLLRRAYRLYEESFEEQNKFDYALGAGVTAHDLGNYSDARRWLEQAIAMRPDDITSQVELARTSLAMGDKPRARRIANDLLARFPDLQAAMEIATQAR